MIDVYVRRLEEDLAGIGVEPPSSAENGACFSYPLSIPISRILFTPWGS
jgi:hypothetical protein